jgi:chemotaxis protein methyltransferase CheR
MIYFDKPVRAALVAEAVRLLRPGGYLIVGHSESLSDLRGGLVPVAASIYRKT